MKRFCFAIIIPMLAITQAFAEDVSLTVYNRDMAVVKLVDAMEFKKGIQTISFTDVAQRIDPTSVRFTAQNGDITVLEQNYRYDIVSTQKVLQHYIDKKVSVWVEGGDLVEGILQSVMGDVLIKGRDSGITILKADVIERFDLPVLPQGLVTRPTLFWKLDSSVRGKTETEVSYITHGFNWHAEYTAVVSDDEKSMEVSSWVSIDNNSGATYENAALKLVAGDIHTVTPEQPLIRRLPAKAMALEEDVAAGFEERELFEYHLYDLQGKTTISNAEIKQIALFDPTVVKSQKQFVYDANKNTRKVAVSMEFINSEKDGLGMALPAGKVRVYKRDMDDTIEFVGEDAIDHTPRNEKVRMTLGYAFDIAAERKIVETRRISPRIREQSIEISLRNRKKETVTITAVEHLWGDWEILKKSIDYVKKDAYTVEFTVDVPEDSEVLITYTVRLK
ncbi:DUF4139 domain-containing protein [Candidatus Latescibacterota bacterium]